MDNNILHLAVEYVKKNIIKLTAWLVFLIIFLLSFRFILLNQHDFIGHNWDWNFPGLKFLSQRIHYASLYSWNDFNLGKNLNLQSHLLLNLPISLLAYVFNTKTIIFCIFVIIIAVSFFSFKKLLNLIVFKSNSNYIPALLYSFSPFLFNEIIGGSWYMWISYACSPLFFMYLIEFVHNRSPRKLIGFILTGIFTIVSLQNFFLIEIIAILFLLFQCKVNLKKIPKIFTNYLFAHLIFIGINLYWIIPFFYSFGTFYKFITDPTFTGNFSGVENTTQGLINIFSLVGYLDRNIYYYTIPSFFVPIFLIAIFLTWVLIIIAYRLSHKKIQLDNHLMIWLVIFLILILLIKGGNPPFAKFTMYLFRNIPLMSLYRSPQHLMFAAAFIIPLLVAGALNYFLKKFPAQKIVPLFFLIVLIWTVGWWYNGDLGHKILKSQKRDFVDFYDLPSDLLNVYYHNEINRLIYRHLFLPTVFSPLFLENDYQSNAQGGIPEYPYLQNPTFSAEKNQLAANIDNKFCKEEKYELIKILSITNTRYLSPRYDIKPLHTECGKSGKWNIAMVQEYINQKKYFHKIKEGSHIKLYLVDNAYFLPLFQVPKKVTLLANEQAWPEITGDNQDEVNSAIFFKNQNKERALKKIDFQGYNKKENIPVIEFKKINPTKYRVKIHQAKNIFPLVFLQSFHSGWKLYSIPTDTLPTMDLNPDDQLLKDYRILEGNDDNQASLKELQKFIQQGWITTLGDGKEKKIKHFHREDNYEKLNLVEKYQIDFISKNFQNTIQNDNLSSGPFYETWLAKNGNQFSIFNFQLNKNVFQIPDDKHLIANGYANSWIIDPDSICQNNDRCTKNPDGSYDFELIVEFWPQRLFYIGLFISGITLLTCLGYIIWDWRRKRFLTKTKKGDEG